MKAMNFLPRKMHMNIKFCLPQVKNSCCKLRNSLSSHFVQEKKLGKKFELGQRSFSRTSPRPRTDYFFPLVPQSQKLFEQGFLQINLREIGIQEMGLARRNSPLGNIVLLKHENGVSYLVFCHHSFTIFPPLFIPENRQCAYLHAHTCSRYRPLRAIIKTDTFR